MRGQQDLREITGTFRVAAKVHRRMDRLLNPVRSFMSPPGT